MGLTNPMAGMGTVIAAVALMLVSRDVRAEERPTAEDPASKNTQHQHSPGDSVEKKACADDESDECGCDGNDRRHRCSGPSISLSVAGVRPALTHVSGPAPSTSEVGVGFAGVAESYALSGKTHASTEWMLGGGQAGFEGKLGGVIEIGYRIDVTEHQGPFGRIGFDGRLQGNDAYYYSALELPRLTAGWQFATKRTMLEIGARGGPILTGRFNPGDGVRSTTGSWEFGGLAAAQIEFLRIEATAFRMDGRDTGDHTPVDTGRANFCAVAGRLGICGDFTAMQGVANFRGPSAPGMHDALVTYVGVTVGTARW